MISFVGSLLDHTLPGEFLANVAQAAQQHPELVTGVQLRFVGARSKKARAQLAAFAHPEMLDIIDQVPKPDAFHIMRDSHALLVLNEDRLSRYIPGKIYDYVASGTPILVFGPGGEVARIVSELHAGLVIGRSPAEFVAAVSRLRAGIEIDHAAAHQWLDVHTREHTSLQFVALLDELTRRTQAQERKPTA